EVGRGLLAEGGARIDGEPFRLARRVVGDDELAPAADLARLDHERAEARRFSLFALATKDELDSYTLEPGAAFELEGREIARGRRLRGLPERLDGRLAQLLAVRSRARFRERAEAERDPLEVGAVLLLIDGDRDVQSGP